MFIKNSLFLFLILLLFPLGAQSGRDREIKYKFFASTNLFAYGVKFNQRIIPNYLSFQNLKFPTVGIGFGIKSFIKKNHINIGMRTNYHFINKVYNFQGFDSIWKISASTVVVMPNIEYFFTLKKEQYLGIGYCLLNAMQINRINVSNYNVISYKVEHLERHIELYNHTANVFYKREFTKRNLSFCKIGLAYIFRRKLYLDRSMSSHNPRGLPFEFEKDFRRLAFGLEYGIVF